MLINLHSIIPFSRVNGPGSRMVIFFQGCDKDCLGCFNPEIQPFENVNLYTPESVFKEYLKDGIDGITVSGGEPFLQPDALLKLLKYAQEIYGLSTVVYTGFRYKEIKENHELYRCTSYIDVLVDGRYIDNKREPTLLARGSTNQRFCCLSGLYEMADFYMPGKVEVAISNDGVVTKTGFSKLQL